MQLNLLLALFATTIMAAPAPILNNEALIAARDPSPQV
jgi:hypothetical protein